MKIATVQHALPTRKVTNDDVLELVREWSTSLGANELADVEHRIMQFFRIAGTDERWWLAAGEKAIDLVLDAGHKALQDAALKAEDIDLVIYTGVGRGALEPAMANIVQHQLGLRLAVGFDVMDACASWLKGMQIAHSLLKTGAYHRAMIVNCEAGFMNLLPGSFNVRSLAEVEHLFAVCTIGEAATATIVTDDNPDDDFYFLFKTFGEHFGLCMVPLPNLADFMPGAVDERYVPGRFFSLSSELVTTVLKLGLDVFHGDKRISGQPYDFLATHAASAKGSEAFLRRAGLSLNVHYDTHSSYGNTVSASVPLAMSLAVQENRLRRGDRALLAVGSAGISIGFASFTF